MGAMERIRSSILRFMYGRNGMDQLNQALLVLYIAVGLLRLPLSVFRLHLLRSLLGIVYTAALLLLIFRFLSKNLPRRQAENQRWITWWWNIRRSFQGIRNRRADKAHRYFTCKACKTICRVPRGKGVIIITCPKCGGQIKAKT